AATVLAACLSAGLLGCAKQAEAPFAGPEYLSWRRTVALTLDYPVPGHQAGLRIPRMNSLGFLAEPVKQGDRLRWSFPEGTVIVKEIYATAHPAAGEGPVELTIMVKRPSDPRSRGGWLWLTKNLPGGEERVFLGDYCFTCHENANEAHPYGDHNPNPDFRDYVYFVPGEKVGEAAPTGSAY
ncbi:MAG TPA: cytochrome P460 family protein, partial [Rectinemataceae bacterium]|nr:cytochrome P460 family protein [Rectinemataceae bacterium]